jgi:hypothetical protein
MLLFRCVQIVRRLSERDRRIGVFCNIAMSSLEDDQFFASFIDFMRENRDLAHAMIFEISVRSFRQRLLRPVGRAVGHVPESSPSAPHARPAPAVWIR